MTDENKTQGGERPDEEKNAEVKGKRDDLSAFIVAVILGALGLLSFILAFSVFKIYGVIAAVVCELCALFCLKKIKNKAEKRVFILKIIIYVLLAAFVLFFIGGIIWAAMQKN